MKTNESCRRHAKNNGVCFWQIAEVMGISEFTLCRKMRHEFSDKDKEAFINAVNQIVKERAADV